MAIRRMFSKTITNSARFLKMPVDSQNLYFHLCINADDDGIVEAFPILRITGSNEDNLRVLAAKNFVRILNEDLVSHITDWNEHNLIRADRKVDSIYKDLLLQIVPDIELIESKPRSDVKKHMDGQWTDNGRTMDSIGEERLGEDSISNKKREIFTPPTHEEVSAYITEMNYIITADEFIDCYSARGWVIGKSKTKMKDWKAAVRTYVKYDKEFHPDKYKDQKSIYPEL